ncbi:MAG: AMP-binding protein, partial [Candidatus Adiutrix sp.]|nr:AMP-binding protein [Candidatus Adiutrix sp.]
MNPETLFNIASLLTEGASNWPDRPAVIAPHRPDALGRGQLSFKELDESSSHLADYLVRSRAAAGSRVIVMVRPGPDFVTVVYGLFKAGLAPVMVDPGMGVRRMLRCLAEGRPSGLVGLPLAHLASLHFRGLKIRVTVGRRLGWGGPTLREIMATPGREGARPPAVATRAGDTAAILFTSGSTGPAKGVVYTQAMFKAQVDIIRQGFGLTEGGVDLVTFPLFGLFSPALGLTSVIPDINPAKPAQASPRAILEPLIGHGATSMFASPTLLDKVARIGHERHLSLPSLRVVISAGAPVSPRVAASFATLMMGGAKLLTPYGATEGVPLSYIDCEEIFVQTRAMTEQGLGMCVGRPLAGVSLEVIKITDEPLSRFSESLKLPMGEIGEIIARGPMVSAAYFERPRETALSLIPDPDGSG